METYAPHVHELRRRLGFHAALLFLLASLTGFLVAGAATQAVPADTGSALASHLNALMGTFLLAALSVTTPYSKLGPKGTSALVWCFLISGYGNWAVTAAKSLLFVRGLEFNGDPKNDVIAAALVGFVVLPTLVGAALWTFGLAKKSQMEPALEPAAH